MVNARSISRLSNIDWDFAGAYSESAFSAIHWHPGRFASQIPASLIGVLSSPGEIVLDPFVGSGTTLVEAQRLGRRSIGIDLSPISCLATRAKTLSLPAQRIEDAIRDISDEATASIGPQGQLRRGKSPRSQIAPTVQGTKWYTPNVLMHLGILWDLIHSFRGIKRLLAEAAFSALLLPVCRETRHWGYVCDNSTPKSDHEGDVLEECLRTLARFVTAYKDRDDDILARSGSLQVIEESKVICGSSKEILRTIPSASIDLVITSPPYFGVCDYVKAQRLSMEWFGKEIEPLRVREVGARSKRHRAAAREAYLVELIEIFGELKRTVRSKGRIAVIVGESKTRHSVLDDVRTGFRSIGFSLELDLNRRVSSQRRQAPSIRGEHVFVLSA
jgi:DNA modification methylase